MFLCAAWVYEENMKVDVSTSGPLEASGIFDTSLLGQERPVRTDAFWLRVCAIFSSWRYGFAAVWLVLVFVAMMGRAHQKPFWSDEVVFRWIAMEPSVHAIYRDLLVPTDIDPPVAQVVTHFAIMAFGSGQIAVRIPEMVGECSALLCLFLALEMYVGTLFAYIGLLFPLSTLLITYGWEARPYGLMYGFLGLAVLSWCHIEKEGARRGFWTALLATSLSLMLGCHFYAVFALPAFCLAQFLRSRRQKQIAWATWLAILGASATEFLYLPIMKAAREYSDGYFERPDLHSLPRMFAQSLPDAGLSLAIFLVLVGAVVLGGVLVPVRNMVSGSSVNNDFLDSEFVALAWGIALVPIIGWVAGILFLKAFVTRYVLYGLIGLFLLLPFFASRLSKGNPVVALLLIGTFGFQGLLVVGRGVSDLLKAPDPMLAPHVSDASLSDLAAIQSAVSTLDRDVVVSDPQVLIEAADYSPLLKSRCVYLADREKELRFNGKTTSSRMLPDLATLNWVRAMPWSVYRNGGFLLLTVPDAEDDYGWLTTEVEQSRRRGPLVAHAGKFVIVQVNPPQ